MSDEPGVMGARFIVGSHMRLGFRALVTPPLSLFTLLYSMILGTWKYPPSRSGALAKA
jgi:hypothetical protein